METNLGAIVEQLDHPKILVLGDLILDRYIWGNAERVSPEAPVLVLRADQEEVRLGGAASVAFLLGALGAIPLLAGVVGDDPGSRVMRTLLTDAGIDHSAVLCAPGRATTTKDRFMGRAANRHANQMLRVDREVRDPIGPKLEDNLIEAVTDQLDGVQVLLISDYAKGVCTGRVLKGVSAAAARQGIMVFVDPARIDNYERYRGVTLLVPNRAEAELATGLSIFTPREGLSAAQALSAAYDVPAVLVKLDRDGMVLFRSKYAADFFPARCRQVHDVTGAGDMVLAAAGLCLGCGTSWSDAVRIANAAAGLEVEKHGVSPVSRQEIAATFLPLPAKADKMVTLAQMVEIAEQHRKAGKTIVFTNGCFDLLHAGHVTYLEDAARLGDVLVVAVNSDASVRRCKGPRRPIIPEADRARMLAALGCVHHVLVFEQDAPHQVLHALQPEFLVKGGTYALNEVVGHETVRTYGGQVKVLSLVDGVSTTAIINDLLSRSGAAAAS